MRVIRRPSDHGTGYAKIIMPSCGAFIDSAGLSQFGLKRLELSKRATRPRPIGKEDFPSLQFAVEAFQQMRAADMVNAQRATADEPPLEGHAVAVSADMKTNHPRTKRLAQLLGVACVVA